jgi:hypothetical protein
MSDFETVKVVDKRLVPVEKMAYGVKYGAKSMNPQAFLAQSMSNSQIQWQIIVPSFETLVSRELYVRTTFKLKMAYNVPVPSAGVPIFKYGELEALQAYPFHSLLSTMQTTINNQTVTCNIQDLLHIFTRSHTKESLALLHSSTPCQKDVYASYGDSAYTINNPNGSFSNTSLDNMYHGNGSWIPDKVEWNNAGTLVDITNTFNNANFGNAIVAGNIGAGNQEFYFTFTTREPVLGLPPFIWANPQNDQNALYGINNMNFLFNVGSANRVWRTGNENFTSCTLSSLTNCYLDFIFMTPSDNMLYPKSAITSYYEMPRYITPIGAIPEDTETTLISQSLQLSSIPDRVFISVKKAYSQMSNADSDSYLQIKKINIQFNNQSGLLSSAQPQDLWAMGVHHSNSNQSWYEWNGSAFARNGQTTLNQIVRTSGPILMLSFADDIAIQDSFYAPSSIGAFNFQVQLTVKNNTGDDIVANEYELQIVTMNSGLFQCSAGVASKFLAVLNKSDVLATSKQQTHSSADVERLVGGAHGSGFLDSLSSIVGQVIPVAKALAPVAKTALGAIDNPYAQAASGVMGAMGFGKKGLDARLK